jgi:arylsulfatase A-like enzyme
LSTPGVARVLRSDELAGGRAAHDPVARAVALSYDPERSGDMVVVPRPYWIYEHAGSGPGATHGTGYGYDTRVPLVLMGPGVRPGHYLEPASPADIAPTLAFLTGVTLARADGRVLSEALLPATAVTAAPKPARPRPAS